MEKGLRGAFPAKRARAVLAAGCGLLLAALLLAPAARGEEILVVEQEYNIIRQDKSEKGVEAKDIRQKLYLSKDFVRIDEFAGPTKQPSESYLIDFKKKTITDLDNEKTTKRTETFAQRRKRIERRKKKIKGDLKVLKGKQKEKTERLYKALLDEDRKYKLERGKKTETQKIAGVEAQRVRVVDARDKKYVPLSAYLHPELEVPYDSAEVLYLMQIVGRKMAEFLKKNKSYFRRLPMQMKLHLAAGGRLRTRVTKVEKVDREKLDTGLFSVPKFFKEKKRSGPPLPDEDDVEPD